MGFADRGPCRCCRKRHVPRRILPPLTHFRREPLALQSDPVKYEHILLAILDSNPLLSSASRNAVATAATLAASNASKL